MDPLTGTVIGQEGIVTQETIAQWRVYNQDHCLLSLRLTLKHISLLGEEELLTCAALVDYRPGITYRMNRKDSVISYGSFLIDYHKPDLFFFRTNAGRGLYDKPVQRPWELTDYLKRQGYYLPGTIEDSLVSLVGQPAAL